MPMYYSKITIKRQAQEVRFHKSIDLPDGLLTLELLAKYVSEKETFAISQVEEGFDQKTILHVYGKRLETEKEVKKRVSKQEKYNKGYDRFHKKHIK